MENIRPIYVTSDLHFYHSNIIKYCHRPYELTDEGVAQMNWDILKEFDKLPDDCIVLNLGDVFYGKQLFSLKDEAINKMKEIIAIMKHGTRELTLVVGNHDKDIFKTYGKVVGIDDCAEFFKFLGYDNVYYNIHEKNIIGKYNVIFTHEPCYIKPNEKTINIHGHTHDTIIKANYFQWDIENKQMSDRVFESKPEDYPDYKPEIVNDCVVNVDKYYNVCYDNLHKIVLLNDVVNKIKDNIVAGKLND